MIGANSNIGKHVTDAGTRLKKNIAASAKIWQKSMKGGFKPMNDRGITQGPQY